MKNKIIVKDQFGEVHTYVGQNIQFSREGTAYDIYCYYPENGTLRRKNIGGAVNPAMVKMESVTVKEKRQADPFTVDALREDTPEEKALLEQYKALEKPKKKRGRPPKKKEALNAEQGESNQQEGIDRESPKPEEDA